MSSLGQQIREFWQNQPMSRRITIIGLMAAVLVLVIVFTVWSAQPSYAVAYSGLSEADAGKIVQVLQEKAIPYKLKNNTTVMVPTDQVYEVRLSMASDGLPASSSVGYELFNSNSFIMTEFTQQVNYQRALEGELERTINNMDVIEASRVHIVIPERTVLTEDQQTTTASITLQVAPGKYLDQNQVRSITYLVSSSVEGLKPGDVVVVDTDGNMLAGGTDEGGLSVISNVDSQYAMELAAAASIQQKVKTLLDAVLGPNRSVVQVNVSMDWTQRELTSQTYNPEETTLRSSQKITESYSTNGADGGVPGAEANLPDTAEVLDEDSSVYNYNREEETLNYEITQVQSLEIQSPGEIEQVSLSVLVDGVDDEEQLATIREAVTAAAGIDVEGRGDLISVSSLKFDTSFQDTQTEEIVKQSQIETYMQIAQIALPVLVVLILLFLVGRLFKGLRTSVAGEWTPIMRPVTEAALAAPQYQPMISAVSGSSTGSTPALEHPVTEEAAPQIDHHAEAEHKFAMPELRKHSAQSAEDEQLQRVITRIAEENPATVAEIIQLWLTEDGK